MHVLRFMGSKLIVSLWENEPANNKETNGLADAEYILSNGCTRYARCELCSCYTFRSLWCLLIVWWDRGQHIQLDGVGR